MTTTTTQDLIDPFTPRIEELLRERDAAYSLGRPVAVLICDLFIYLMRMMAAIAERKRAGDLAAMVLAAVPDQTEINVPIVQAAGEVSGCGVLPCEVLPCEVRGVEQPPGLPLPRRVRVRKLKVLAGQAPARRRHVDHGCWLQWRGVGVFWIAEVGRLGIVSTKRGCGDRDLCACFVTI